MMNICGTLGFQRPSNSFSGLPLNYFTTISIGSFVQEVITNLVISTYLLTLFIFNVVIIFFNKLLIQLNYSKSYGFSSIMFKSFCFVKGVVMLFDFVLDLTFPQLFIWGPLTSLMLTKNVSGAPNQELVIFDQFL